MYVIKRDNSIVDFNSNKIKIAIEKANNELDETNRISENEIVSVVDTIVKLCEESDHMVSVEEIQDHVIDELALARHFKLMHLYSEYRFKHALIRETSETDESILSLIRGDNKELNEENSNKSVQLISTQRDYMAGEVSKDLSRKVLLPEKIVRAHDEGILHFHDMDYFVQKSFNCCLVNITDMLDNGTVMNGKMIESPHTFRVGCTIVTQIIAAVASNQYGGQSVDMRALGKYLRRSKEKIDAKLVNLPEDQRKKIADDLLHDELSAGVQTIQYQINTLMTTNGQAPFVTLFLYIDKDDPYIEENVMIIEEILKQRIQGIKNKKGIYITPAFPKLIYVLDEINNLSGGKYDYITELAAECTAKRMYPDYISAKKMREYYQGNVYGIMGCRSILAPWKDKDGNYKFEGRFNQGVVSINLPQIAIIANKDEDKFWSLLDERLQLCFEALMCRHENCKKILSDNSPIHWQNGAIARLPEHSSVDELLYGGYSSISLGYIGLYETTKLMKGVSHTDPTGTEFALRVMNKLRETTDRWKAETNIGFALYGTPAESLCYRFARIDKKKFGIIEDVTDKGYYTNSYHVDVREKINAYDKLKFESQFQPISAGGCISYVEIPNMRKNIEALKSMIKFIYDTILYAEFNTKSDYCQVCGFDGEIELNDKYEWVCPQCGNKDKSKMNVVRRTCGYIGENFWNVGKTKEIKERVLHVD